MLYATLLALAAASMGAIVAPKDDLALELVVPSVADKNRVRWWEFDWRQLDFVPVEGMAPVRFYFYDSEREVAERAKAMLADACVEYVDRFGHKPTRRFPFILYNSHAEFESTNAFFVSEGVLGVTNVEQLTMAMPYWGEHQRFRDVMRHELAHQFMIQKVVDESRVEGQPNPIAMIPLWFTEGVAQRFALPGIDAQVRGELADLLRSEDRLLPNYFQDGPYTFERIYLVGHAQVHFLDVEFGSGTVRRVLDAVTRIQAPPASGSFGFLLAQTVGTSPEELDRRWQRYVEREVGDRKSAAHVGKAVELEGLGIGEIDTYSLAADGRTLLYRLLDRQTGRSRLYLRDLDDPSSAQLVTGDRRMRLVTLHPIDRRVTGLGAGLLAYIGRAAATDVLYVRTYKRVQEGGRVRFKLGRVVEHDLARWQGLIEAGYPAVSSDGSVSFVGLSRDTGNLDIFRIEKALDPHSPPVRLTQDVYAEKDLVADDGRLYFARDSTSDGRYELFRMKPGSTPEPVSEVEGDASQPFATPEGLLFRTDGTGFYQAYRAGPGGVVRLTDDPSRFEQPALAASGDLVGVSFEDGRRKLVRLPKDVLLSQPVDGAPPAGTPWLPPSASLSGDRGFDTGSPRNYTLVAANLLAAGGPVFIGSFAWADPFQNRVFGADIQIVGDSRRSGGTLYIADRSQRLTRAAAVFADASLQVDPDRPETDTFRRRRLGVQLGLSYPLGVYTRVEGYVSPQLLSAGDFEPVGTLLDRELSGTTGALEAGAGIGIDTTRRAISGPVDGGSFLLQSSVTQPFGAPKPFASATADLQGYRPIVSRWPRLHMFARVAGGTSGGGRLRDQFYVPSSYNLRALHQAESDVVGDRYLVGTAELRFPLDRALPLFPFVEGIAGVDAGSIYFEQKDFGDNAVAAMVFGVNLGFGPTSLRIHFARPFRIGGRRPDERWLWHVTLGDPLFLF